MAQTAQSVPIQPSFHTLPPEKVLSELQVSLEAGLTSKEVEVRRQRYGENVLAESSEVNPWRIFFRQFKSVMILILIVAAALSYFLGHPIDAAVIVVLIIINALIGFYQEYQAEKAVVSLKKLVQSTTKVRRNGEIIFVKPQELVVGDVMILEGGDKIPADGRVIKHHGLQTIESSLTSESTPVSKQTGAVPEKTGISDRINTIYMGTLVASGTAEAVVTATGNSTQLGQIAVGLSEIEEEPTHYEQKTKQLTTVMGGIAIASAIVTFIVGYFIRQFDLYEMTIFTIATLVSALPESLPIILVVVLAIGAERMAKRNAIVRRLAATETLGVVSVIMTDKTGTLTVNQMRTRQIQFLNEEPIMITPIDKKTQTTESAVSQGDQPLLLDKHDLLKDAIKIAGTCINVRKTSQGQMIGDPTEVALYTLAEQFGVYESKKQSLPTKLDDMPFVQDLKLRACVAKEKGAAHHCLYSVGAPEAILQRSTSVMTEKGPQNLTAKKSEKLTAAIEEMSAKGMRVLGLGYKEVSSHHDQVNPRDLNEMTFVAVVGLIDPPRPEIKKAIQTAHQAGIRVVMTTGDHPLTARTIAEDVGLVKDGVQSPVLTDSDIESLSDDELTNKLEGTKIFARLSPMSKLRIAKLFQAKGEVVAMTGDGVNDAPALKQADVGISMGKVGTDVARDASEIVLADDNFSSIINAVREGRTQFSNIRRTSAFLIVTNVAESASLLIALLVGFPIPLLPLQILWLNIITGGINDFALATEQSHEDVMKVAPRDPKEKIMIGTLMPLFFTIVSVMVILVFGVFTYFLPAGVEKARTAAFAVLSLALLLNMYNFRALHHSVLRFGLFSNKMVNRLFVLSLVLMLLVLYVPQLQQLFSFVSLSVFELASLFVCALLVFFAGEAIKLFFPAGSKYRKVNLDEV